MQLQKGDYFKTEGLTREDYEFLVNKLFEAGANNPFFQGETYSGWREWDFIHWSLDNNLSGINKYLLPCGREVTLSDFPEYFENNKKEFKLKNNNLNNIEILIDVIMAEMEVLKNMVAKQNKTEDTQEQLVEEDFAKQENAVNNGFTLSRVFHYRNPTSKGGITFVLGFIGDRPAIGISMCSPEDQFCRKTGVEIAIHHAHKIKTNTGTRKEWEKIFRNVDKNGLFIEVLNSKQIKFGALGNERVKRIASIIEKRQKDIDYIDFA